MVGNPQRNRNIHPESDLAEEWVFEAASRRESKPRRGARQIQKQRLTPDAGCGSMACPAVGAAAPRYHADGAAKSTTATGS